MRRHERNCDVVFARIVPTMLTHVEFRSNNFPPEEGEEELVNFHLWGKRLADFLRTGLEAHGYQGAEPFAEDWGWVVEILNQPFRLWIGCGHQYGDEDSYLCFIQPDRPLVRKFLRKIDTRDRVAQLQQILDKILSDEPSIHAKRWWTDEEFNQAATARA